MIEMLQAVSDTNGGWRGGRRFYIKWAVKFNCMEHIHKWCGSQAGVLFFLLLYGMTASSTESQHPEA